MKGTNHNLEIDPPLHTHHKVNVTTAIVGLGKGVNRICFIHSGCPACGQNDDTFAGVEQGTVPHAFGLEQRETGFGARCSQLKVHFVDIRRELGHQSIRAECLGAWKCINITTVTSDGVRSAPYSHT